MSKAGWDIDYDYQFDPSGKAIPLATPPGPNWLRKLLGDDLFVNVRQVVPNDSEVSDAGLENLGGLPQLEKLSLC